MSKPNNPPGPSDESRHWGFEAILEEIVRRVVREELKGNGHNGDVLLTAEQLAPRLGVAISWVREQARQGNIPTHRLGHYVRFDLGEVLQATKKRDQTP